MLKKEKLYDFLDEHWFLMLSHLVAFPVNHDQEELHRLRVEIKKIRALAWFITKTDDRKNLDRSMLALKNVFSGAGAVRNNYIRLLQLEQFLPDQDHQALRKKIGGESRKFIGNINRYVRNINRTYENIRKTIGDIETGEVEKLHRKQLAKIQKELGMQENWHEARKRMKKLMYLYNLMSKKIKQRVDLDENYLDKLQELVGQWHDTTVSLPQMKKKITRVAYGELQEQNKATAEKIRSTGKHFKRDVFKA